ncbi:AzlD domain-containing protein [Flavimaricola marinus]|uniref:Branched-chain amino acid transport protein (AzlD) n=1 Tax=Flavimaricola marinus TaxID=1819565 RepID=A0A238LB60_9RHOB|nr:AzlD domain-containing protein [Flavimaricola marinus]SMY06841.1 Branched-chain amino acid transport protein (AzlD) [Flavimaricola marinus]
MIADSTVWIVIAGLGLGSFILRFSVMGLTGRRPMPPWLLRHLRYAGVAILPGLVAPLVLGSALQGGPPDIPRVVAALVTLTVGWWRRDVLLSMLAGGVTFFALRGIEALL